MLGERPSRLPLSARKHQRLGARPETAEEPLHREDRVLAHLPALHILLNGTGRRSGSPPPTATEVISHLREREIALIYEPETRTLRTNTPQEVKITIDSAR